MTVQAPLPLAPFGAVQIGEVAALVEDADGAGRVYVRGELAYLWDGQDEAGRRLAAVALVRIGAATGAAVATGFDIGRETLRRWVRAAQSAGTAGLVPERRGPRGPSKLTPAVVAEIGTRRAGGASLRAVASAVGV
ncbi:helix-turn-helix domain-containing protein [Pseudactinotalea sp. HY158]|uniref:helix-turn-helix domain-containing protein n=1 Tax=Pseudactinotalea sp. HY158 TaxID=2654547 RepID=UPI00189266B8|nr:helix-turn-helix domain-containing protein [Pseudactinotalea sp. HY158]